MWDAFCSLVFACGGFSNLFISGGCCVSVCICRVASVHAACVQVDDIKAAVPYFPCGFILSVGGRGFLMVFHLNTVGLVPTETSVTSLFLSLPPSSALSGHTWGLQAQTASARCVPNTNWDTHAHTNACRAGVCVPSARVHGHTGSGWFSISCMYFTLFSVLYWIFEQAEHLRSVPSPPCLSPLLFLRRLWSHLWHNSSISHSNITVYTSETLFVLVKVMYVYVVFWKCQNSVCFSFLRCFRACARIFLSG